MDRPTKEHILREIRRIADEDGSTSVGIRRFVAETGIPQSAWMGRYWVRWSDAVQEAGLEVGTFTVERRSDDDLLRVLAELTREFGHLPTRAELRMHRNANPEAPGSGSFRRRLGETAAAMHDRLLSYADANPEFSDVAEILTETGPRVGAGGFVRKGKAGPSPSETVVTGAVYLLRMGEFHKIGKSNDPGRRIYELGIQLPEKHDVVHVIETDDPAGIESYWHRRFASQRANGEWFRLSADDVTAFQRRAYM